MNIHVRLQNEDFPIMQKKKAKQFLETENIPPPINQIEVDEKKNESLEENAKKISSIIQQKIDQSHKNVDEAISQIALYQNKAQTRKTGFKTKLKTKLDEQKDKYQELLKDIQSQISIQLADNEKITSQIDNLTQEIEALNKPQEAPSFEPINIDYSKKTEKILKEREIEIRKKCDEEFEPLFKKIEIEHSKNIEAIEEEFNNQVQNINQKADEEIISFVPRVFITQEEIRVRKEYENIFQKEKIEFEKKRDELKEKILNIQVERDKIIQGITDEVDEQLFNEEKIFHEKIKEIKESIVEPQMPDITKEFEFTPEQEEEFKKNAEQKLNERFQQILQESIEEVAQRRELMESEMIKYEETTNAALKKKYATEIEDANKAISSQKEEIEFLKAEINSLKAEWNDMNQSRRDKDDIAQRLEKQIVSLKEEDKRVKVEIENARYEEDDEPDDELLSMQQEIDKLAKDMKIAKKYHVHLMSKKKAKHTDSLSTIQRRVSMLIQSKDEKINELANELKNIKRKTKELNDNLQVLLSKYQS